MEIIDTLQKQTKKGDSGPIMVLTKSKLRKIFSLARSLDDSGLDAMDSSVYTEDTINKHIAKAMQLN